jgi:hypothetical protein
VGGVSLDLHAAAAAVSLLAAPELAIEEWLIDFQAGGDAGEEGDEGLSVGFTGSEVAQHSNF